jgi:hypothetical protein
MDCPQTVDISLNSFKKKKLNLHSNDLQSGPERGEMEPRSFTVMGPPPHSEGHINTLNK